MILVALTYGIIQVEFAAGTSDSRRPKGIAELSIRFDERAAGKCPLEEITRLQQRKDFANGFAAGLKLSGSDGIIDISVSPNKRICKVAAVNRIGVHSLLHHRRHAPTSTRLLPGTVGRFPDMQAGRAEHCIWNYLPAPALGLWSLDFTFP